MVKVSWKRALAGVMAAALTVLAIPAAAFAEEPEELILCEEAGDKYYPDGDSAGANIVDAEGDTLTEDGLVVDDSGTAEAVNAEDIVPVSPDESIGEEELILENPEEAISADAPVLEGADEAGETLAGAEPVEEDKAGTEPTNPANPQNVLLGQIYSGHLPYSEKHYYKFDLKKPARVYFKLTSPNGVGINLVDNNHNGTDYSGTGCSVHWYKDSYTTQGTHEYVFSLTGPHTYYMEFYYFSSNTDYSFTINTVEPPIPTGGESIIDPNLRGSRSDAAHAYEIKTDKKYVSMLTINKGTTNEYYKFQVYKDNTPLYLTLNSPEITRMQFVLYYDGAAVSDHVGLKQYGFVDKGSGYSKVKLVTTDVPWRTPRLLETDKFPKGTYYLWISQNGGYQDSGYYNLEIGTKAGVPVKSVALDKKKIALGKGGTEKLTATVKPDNADEKSVVWKSSNELVAKVDSAGNVKAVSTGKATVTATSAVNDKLIAVCEVYVADVVVDNTVKVCPLNVVKEKVDTGTAQYFGRKYDKYEVSDPKVGSVDAKGFFTSKKEGTVEIKGLVKADGKLFVCAKRIRIEVKQPTVTYPLDSKGKEIKFFTATYEGQIFYAGSVIDNKGAAITGWQLSDKKGNFELLDNGGRIRCNKNGTNTKITPLYGAEKTPGNISFTLKTITPKLSATSKVKQQTGQNFTLKLSNCTEADAISWKFVPDASDSRVYNKNNAVTIEDVKAANPSKLQKKITINKAVNGKIVATVAGHDYVCAVDVVTPEIKAGTLNLKVGKAGTVGVKNTKLKDITWQSSNPSRVTVTDPAKGKIKAEAAGSAVISANIGGITVQCAVTVN